MVHGILCKEVNLPTHPPGTKEQQQCYVRRLHTCLLQAKVKEAGVKELLLMLGCVGQDGAAGGRLANKDLHTRRR